MLLPAVERRGEIQFYIAKSMPYGARLTLSFSLMLCGIALQLAAGGKNGPVFIAAGAVCLFAGVLLLLVKGYQNIVRTAPAIEWRPAGDNEIERILSLYAEQRKWDQDFFDITCGRGILGFILTAAVVGVAVGFAAQVSDRFALLILIDAAVLLIPFWFTGVRFILKNAKFIVKIRTLLNVKKAYEQAGGPGFDKFLWQLQVAKTTNGAGEVPQDVKAVLQPAGAPPSFLGLQMQVCINSVQGNDYPYFYCVLVAKPELGLLEHPLASPPRKITVERDRQGEMDVVIIRQTTTKNSGYHTNGKTATNIFLYALDLARQVAR
ncbi:MAG: hypothetical protein NTZ09_05640 [Candidatus Hydrogenedentes bacterium]|nr:hypothetical protein [Candidatus Hydrogenedentota bacterium]